MFRDLVRFELGYQFSQTLIRVAVAAFFLLGFFLGYTLYAGPNVYRLAPIAIAQGMVLLSLSSFFGLALFTGNAVLRDRTHGMEPLVHTTPVTFFSFLSSRLLGLIVVVFLVVGLAGLGMVIGGTLPSPHGAEVGPLRISAFLSAFFTFTVPNVFLGLSLLFCVATLCRGQIAVYVAGIALFIVYIVGSMLSNSPVMAQSKQLSADETKLAVLLDPFGVFPLYEQVRYWDLAAKNTQLILLEGDLLANRLIWMTVSLALCCIAYRFFRFREAATTGRTPAIVNRPLAVSSFAGLQPVRPRFGGGFVLRTLCSKIAVDMQLMVRGLPLLLLSLLCLFLFGMVLTEEMGRGDLGVPLAARAALIIPELQDPMRILGPLVVIFFTAEWAWLEREHRFDGIVDSSAVPSVVLWVAKWLGLGCLILFLISLAVMVGAGYQLVRGAGIHDLSTYARLYGFVGFPLWFFAGWVLALQNFLPNKYLGMLAGAGLLVLARALRNLFQWELSFLTMPFFPAPHMSEMTGGGYGDDVAFWGMLLHLGAALLVGAAALFFLRRGHKRRAFGVMRPVAVLAVVGLTALVASAGVVFYKTHFDMQVASGHEIEAWRAGYEKTYRATADRPQPVYRAGRVQVDVFPERRRYQVTATYRFMNPHAHALEQMTLTTPPLRGLRCRTRVEGANRKDVDSRFGVETYVFETPLQPGEEGQLHFELTVKQSGFGSMDGEHYVLPGGSYIELSKFVPNFGYLAHLELTNDPLRRKFGLPAHSGWGNDDDSDPPTQPWFSLELTASAPAGSRALSLGRLEREWESDGRHFSTFRIDQISSHWYALSVGDYAVAETTVDDVRVAVWYRPGHEANVQTMLDAAAGALSYFQTHWGEYPYQDLRIVEIPAFSARFGATSYATTIFAVESRLFLLDQQDEDAFNMVGRIVAHEVGHQWWGGMVNPAPVAGYRMLTEVLCEYAESAVFAEWYGWDEERFYLDEVAAKYFFFRGYDAVEEPSLHRIGGETHPAYFKGAHAMHLATQFLGRETVNQRLAAFFEAHRFPARPRSTDLLAILLEDVPTPQRVRLEELFKRVVTYDLRLREANRDTDDLVHLAIQVEIQGDSAENRPMELEWIALDQKRRPLGEPQTVTVKAGDTAVRVKVPLGAASIEVDPRRLYLEANRGDNRRTITLP
ncbi:M1 family aminopeptidase [Acanthopleuribacter pedis]|uniref:Peptidase M1 membrane alanine aminopeptidase domain-containing protein n=1 Tax=Acanthopleuribacter pedis TaxID=442870 RepID=A0A8J7QB75_9BACT|nr:M1 family aminopeptidase [Acanthopleuribacter pedis]MBO1317681.1 hypothetical protein [Acanthopleuribacter pedis]